MLTSQQLQNKRHRSQPVKGETGHPVKHDESEEEEEEEEESHLVQRVDHNPAYATGQALGVQSSALPSQSSAGPGSLASALTLDQSPNAIYQPSPAESRAHSPCNAVRPHNTSAPPLGVSPVLQDNLCYDPLVGMNQAIKAESGLDLEPVTAPNSMPGPEMTLASASPNPRPSVPIPQSGSVWMFQDEVLRWRERIYDTLMTGGEFYQDVSATIPPACTVAVPVVGAAAGSTANLTPYNTIPPAFWDPRLPLTPADAQCRTRSSLAAAGVGPTSNNTHM